MSPTVTLGVAGKIIVHLPQGDTNYRFLRAIDSHAYYHYPNRSWYLDRELFEATVESCLRRYAEVTTIVHSKLGTEPTILRRTA